MKKYFKLLSIFVMDLNVKCFQRMQLDFAISSGLQNNSACTN